MTTILIVDDNASLRRLNSLILRNHGYDVFNANDGRQALDILDHTQVDLVIADIAMPGLDGLSLLRHIRAQAQFQSLSVIILTASGVDHDRIKAQAEGVNLFLTKPTMSWELLEAVSKVLAETSPKSLA